MNAFKLNIFPTQLFVFDFDDKDIEPVVKETIKLESQIKICNYLTPENGMFGNGYTDWSNPIRNKEYEKLLLKVAHELLLKKYKFDIEKYWHSFYIGRSVHQAHIHSSMMRHNFDFTNYSSILSLTDLGQTRFLSSNHSSDEVDCEIKSQKGRLIIFPSNLMHDAENTEGKRMIIAANMSIVKI